MKLILVWEIILLDSKRTQQIKHMLNSPKIIFYYTFILIKKWMVKLLLERYVWIYLIIIIT